MRKREDPKQALKEGTRCMICDGRATRFEDCGHVWSYYCRKCWAAMKGKKTK